MAKTPDQYNSNAPVAKPDGSAAPFFVQQWNLLLSFVKESLASVADLVAGVAAALAAAQEAATAAAAAAAEAAAATAPTGVVAGSYTNTNLTVGEDGRLTAASNGGGGGGSAWTLVASTNFATTPVVNWDVINLAAYTDIMLVMEANTLSAVGFRVVRVSVNNGASFFSAGGDYITNLTTGLPDPVPSAFGFGSDLSTPAHWGTLLLNAAAVNGTHKVGVTNQDTRTFIASTLPINALRLTSTTGATMNGGTAYVLAR